jgi:hypothetical protein
VLSTSGPASFPRSGAEHTSGRRTPNSVYGVSLCLTYNEVLRGGLLGLDRQIMTMQRLAKGLGMHYVSRRVHVNDVCDADDIASTVALYVVR